MPVHIRSHLPSFLSRRLFRRNDTKPVQASALPRSTSTKRHAQEMQQGFPAPDRPNNSNAYVSDQYEERTSLYAAVTRARRKKDYALAISVLNTIMTKYEHDIAAREARGFCFQAMGCHKEAIEDFDACLLRSEHSYFDLTARALSLRVLGLHAQSENDFKRAINIQPAFWRSLMGLARLYVKVGRLEDALPYFDRACEMGGEKWLARRDRGDCLRRLGLFDRALEDLGAAAHTLSSDSVIILSRSLCLLGLGKRDLAIVEMLKIPDTHPSFAFVETCVGSLMHRRDEDLATKAMPHEYDAFSMLA